MGQCTDKCMSQGDIQTEISFDHPTEIKESASRCEISESELNNAKAEGEISIMVKETEIE